MTDLEKRSDQHRIVSPLCEIRIVSPYFVSPSREALFAAIEEVEKLAEWLEEPMFAIKYRR